MAIARCVTLLVLVLSLFLAPGVIEAQQAGKPFRIGVLFVPTAGKARLIIERLGELGYVEGRDYVIEYRYADGNYDRLPELAADLVRAKVDLW